MKKKLIQKTKKLLKLKDYVTVQEAAQKLTTFLGLEVSQADVLRFALEGSLKLSVNFANIVKAKRGEIVAKDELTSKEAPPTEGCPPILFRNWVDIGGGQCIKLDDKVVSLEGLSPRTCTCSTIFTMRPCPRLVQNQPLCDKPWRFSSVALG